MGNDTMYQYNPVQTNVNDGQYGHFNYKFIVSNRLLF